MFNRIDLAVESTCEFFNNEFNYLPASYDIGRCKRLLSKLAPLIALYPQFFEDKKILDFGSGQGEHSYLMTYFADEVYSYDISQNNMLRQFKMFYDCKKIKVLRSEAECFDKYDTFVAISLLHLIDDPVNWLVNLSKNIVADNYILVVNDKITEDHGTDFYRQTFTRQTQVKNTLPADIIFDNLKEYFHTDRMDYKDYGGNNRVAIFLKLFEE